MANGEKCNNKDCKTIVTETRRKDGQYKKYCSLSCQRLGVADKIKQTSLEKYGVSNPSKSKVVKDQIKDSFTEKYGAGITNAMHLQEFKDKIVDTNIERYGTAKPQLLEENKNKTKQSNIEKFGTERPQQLQSLKDRAAATCIDRYGVSSPQQNKIIRQKTVDTCLEKYGVSNAMQDPGVFEYNMKRQSKSKSYTFQSGKIVTIQGYEAYALDTLLETYSEKEIVIGKGAMPAVRYFADNATRRYFPDIYIPKDNLIIEVKSVWTLNTNRSRNMAKRQACLDAGYNFRFMIFDKEGNLAEDK